MPVGQYQVCSLACQLRKAVALHAPRFVLRLLPPETDLLPPLPGKVHPSITSTHPEAHFHHVQQLISPTMGPTATEEPSGGPSAFAYILSFLLVGICWGFTTPFIRRAAVNYTPPTNPSITDPSRSWLSRQIAKAFFTVIGLVRKPAYAIPLVANLTGSIWFFLLVGQAGTFYYHQDWYAC